MIQMLLKILKINNNVLETPSNSEHDSIVKVANNGSGNKYTLEGVSQTISLVKGLLILST